LHGWIIDGWWVVVYTDFILSLHGGGTMAMKRRKPKQAEFWVPTADLARSPGHPFYERLNRLLSEHGFDPFVEERCAKFYAERMGRPSIPPGVYFRMLLVGYFEGLDSEREIAWRCADSLSLREFLGYGPGEAPPDHSTLSVIRRRIDVETHQEVFGWVLELLARQGLIRGKTVGVDATTLEANAALRSIVRRDTGEGYEEYLKDLARASGIETPTREDAARLDRKRAKKGSNKEWEHPRDPEARITKMKDGRTHLAHMAEHAVDLDTSAIVAVTVQEADRGDTQTIHRTVTEACENLREIRDAGHDVAVMDELVADKGYHSNEVLEAMEEAGIRSYVSEPDRGRRKWKDKRGAQRAVYANRRRIRGERGKRMLRQRGEKLERSFAHAYETGGMRRVHLRGHTNILKRVLVHVAGFNLGLVLRTLFGAGTPRAAAALAAARTVLSAILWICEQAQRLVRPGIALFIRPGRSAHPDSSAAAWIATS
jgi:transposase